MSEMMTVVLLEPHKKARIIEFEHTLESMQNLVGGYIEAVYPFEDEVAIICNDEGKINGMPYNRAIREEDTNEIMDIVAGPFFVCGLTEDNFGSLSEEQQQKYLNMFRYPERFVCVDTEILATKYDPTKEDRDR